jgi:transposase
VSALSDLETLLLATWRTVVTGAGTGKAIDLALKRWKALERYAASGTLLINHNLVENAVHPITIGKKTDFLPAPNALAAMLPRSRASLLQLN